MHSARIDPRGLLQRLNVRLVLVLASITLVALLVSGIALSQILPGYFLDQARRRAETAAISTAILVQSRAQFFAETRPAVLLTRELRDTQLLQVEAERAARALAQGTVEIRYAQDGSVAAMAVPDSETDADLRAEGLAPDPQVDAQSFSDRLVLAPGFSVELIYTVRNPYTNRAETVRRVGEALILTGLAALAVSLVIGILAARRLTGPLARLRRASGRFAQGDLEERSPRFGIVEVDDVAQAFNVMADRLSESVRMLQADRDRLREFVADVSHELRTPIAALRTFTELQRDGAVDDEERAEFLDRSTEQISRLEWMSTNLLDLSRIDSGIFPLDMRWGDLRDPVRSVVEAQAEMAEQRGVSLVSEVPTNPVMLRFDRERVVQLLTNLVGNALKFTQRGGEVVASLAEAPDGAVLEVRDSGPGIPPAEQPLVFDRFFRGTNVGEARASGSGLGLAIVRSIVEMHGGTITVSSAPGEGSTFTVRLPRADGEGS
ncbi:MAG TPA: HAMP domain-containing sensor histidine kinase [Candidatus Limnocylindria bacterium]|nr:HAMP domain-containing sensor histidine kinase [Candidatus Limnocylindria bacterium]